MLNYIDILNDTIDDVISSMDKEESSFLAAIIRDRFMQYDTYTLIYEDGYLELTEALSDKANTAVVDLVNKVGFFYARRLLEDYSSDRKITDVLTASIEAGSEVVLSMASEDDLDNERIKTSDFGLTQMLIAFICEAMTMVPMEFEQPEGGLTE